MEKKTRMIGVRVTEDEYKKLKESKVRISDLLRKALEEDNMANTQKTEKVMVLTFKNEKGEESTKKIELISSKEEMLSKIELATSIAASLKLSLTIEFYPSFELTWPSSEKAS